jgi:hypothetical protein
VAPRQHRRRICLFALLDRRCLPEEASKLAGAGDDDLAAGLAAAVAQVHPARVKTTLRTPGDLTDPGILAFLAKTQLGADFRAAPAVLSCLDQDASGVGGPALVIDPWRRCSSEVRSEGVMPR